MARTIAAVIAVVLVVSALALFRDNVVSAFDEARSCVTGACLEHSPPDCNHGRGSDGGQRPCN